MKSENCQLAHDESDRLRTADPSNGEDVFFLREKGSGSQIPTPKGGGLVASLHLNSSASRRVLMLQLHRLLHWSATMQLGHLTTGPSSPSMPSEERSLSAGNAFDCLPAEAVSVVSPLCPPTSPLPVIGWLPCVEAVLPPLPLAFVPDLRGVPRRYRRILFDERKIGNRKEGALPPTAKACGYPRPKKS